MPNLDDEPWRRLGNHAAPKPHQINLSAIRANLDELQEARRKTLMRDFDFMQAWQTGDTTYVVVNFKSISVTDVNRGRYDVDMSVPSCACRDQFYTYADEGSGIYCKHVLFVALLLRGGE